MTKNKPDFRHGKKYALVLLYALFITDASAQRVKLFKDLCDAKTNFTTPTRSIVYNGNLYFDLGRQETGIELYKTDGTIAGTSIVKDISNYSSSYPIHFSVYNGKIYFSAYNYNGGPALYKTDGTEQGTEVVKKISVGTGSSSTYWKYESFVELNGLLYFIGAEGAHGLELWKTDGTPSGTKMVKDIWKGKGSAFTFSDKIQLFKKAGILYFVANDSIHGLELWKSDGTAAGTRMVRDIIPGKSSGIRSDFFLINEFNNEVYFNAIDSLHGSELWKTDGTRLGTQLVKDIWPGKTGSINYHKMEVVGNHLLFGANDSIHGLEWWVTDGTTAGTTLLKDICTGINVSSLYFQTYVQNYTYNDNNGSVYFFARDNSNGYQLWKTNGTTAGTYLYQKVAPVVNPLNRFYLYKSANSLYTFSDTTNVNAAITRINPNDSTITVIASNLNYGTNWSFAFNADINDKLWLAIENNVSYTNQMFILNELNDSLEIFPEYDSNTVSSAPANFVDYNAKTYFTAYDMLGLTSDLWCTDGTLGGTYKIKDQDSSTTCSWSRLRVVNNKIISSTNSTAKGPELIVSDGTQQGTYPLDVVSGTNGINPLLFNVNLDYNPSWAMNEPILNGKMFFVAYPTNGWDQAIWVTDGTVAGTHSFFNPWQGSFDERIYFRSYFKNGFIFSAYYYLYGFKLYYTNGVSVTPLTGLTFDDFNGSLNFKGKLYFTDNSTSSGKIRSIDTNLVVSSIYSAGMPIRLLGADSNYFYFHYKSPVYGDEIWKSDGTSGGTALLKDINISGSALSDYTGAIQLLNGNILFPANDSIHGNELWISDGTTQNTVLLKDINPNGSSVNTANYQFNLFPFNHLVYFFAWTPVKGRELWKTDGTANGTTNISDINVGRNDAGPSLRYPKISDSRMFFGANDGNQVDWWWMDTLMQAPGHFEIEPGYSDAYTDIQFLKGRNLLTAFSPKYGAELYEYSFDNFTNKNISCMNTSACAGSDVDVAFYVPFHFGPGNHTLIELSDSSGSFVAPITLDTIIGNSGQMSVTIPWNITGGSHYRIRYKTTIPVNYSGDNGSDIAISVPPAITCQDSVFYTAPPSQCTVVAGYSPSFNGFPAPMAEYNRLPGSIYAVGETILKTIAWNGCGTDSCFTHVIVRDTIPPQISCPSTVFSNDSMVTYSVNATDNCGIASLVVLPPSGSIFNAGTTPVNAVAYDNYGNSSSCTFNVVVAPSPLKSAGNQEYLSPVNYISVEPTLATSFTWIKINSENDAGYYVIITDIMGRTVLKQSLGALAGLNQFKISLENFNPGVYLVYVFINSENIYRSPLIVK